MREEITAFAEEMEKIMRENDKEKGDSWKHMDIVLLEVKLDEEINEWKRVRHKIMNIDEKKKELVDIANICMMLWNRLQNNQ